MVVNFNQTKLTVTSPSSSPQLIRRHRCHSPSHPSSQIVDRRSEITLPLLWCSVVPQDRRSDSSEIGESKIADCSLCLYSGAQCSLRPSLKVKMKSSPPLLGCSSWVVRNELVAKPSER
nr:uncharacterized protein LOC111987327 [Quercus suber]